MTRRKAFLHWYTPRETQASEILRCIISISNGERSVASKKHITNKAISLHQFIHSPPNIQASQITIMLTHPQKHHRNSSSVHHTDKRTDHIAHSIAL
jgi:hypothetical protein